LEFAWLKKHSSNFPSAEIRVWLIDRESFAVKVSGVASITGKKQSREMEMEMEKGITTVMNQGEGNILELMLKTLRPHCLLYPGGHSQALGIFGIFLFSLFP